MDYVERPDWVWYLVVDEEGNIDEGFNSFVGAKLWTDEHGGTIIKVKEVKT